ncbi:MAG: membrane bound O-acyl transferase family-domain-containing protein [Planctomycetota bacterium]
MLLFPTIAVFGVGNRLAPWQAMVVLAMSTFASLKWVTLRDARRSGLPTPTWKAAAWFLAWPGTDGRAFFALAGAGDSTTASRSEWGAAIVKLVSGVALAYGLAPRVEAHSTLLAGWVGMVGTISSLHFGGFHLLSLAWRRFGIAAVPIMNEPTRATSLASFWGARWNRAFSTPARRFVLLPLGRRVGLRAAAFVVFVLSGALHELVISLPARGGYGLPTAYFGIQALALAFERTRLARRLGLGRGLRGWMFTLAITALPLPWLFHRPFVERVILPMLRAAGVLEGT